MLVRIALLLQLCFALNEAAQLNRYRSQTIAHVKYTSRVKHQVCDCKDGKCTLNEVVTANVCETIQKRFEYRLDPNQYFILCEFNPETCTQQNETIPEVYKVDIIFDMWYFFVSQFFLGGHTSPRAFKSLIATGVNNQSIGAENKPVEVNETEGKPAMPIEMYGILKIPESEADKYYYCTTKACLQFINQFCDEFSAAMRVSNPILMEKFIGCTIRRVYPAGEKLGIDWSIMFHFQDLIKARKIDTQKKLDDQIKILKDTIKLPSLLESFTIGRYIPVDVCEISAKCVTNQKFHDLISDPISPVYLSSSSQYSSDLAHQLMLGEEQRPSCFRNTLELQFFNDSNYVRVQMRVHYSLTCLQKRGVRSCANAVGHITNYWKKGSQQMRSTMAKHYEFSLYYDGTPFKS